MFVVLSVSRLMYVQRKRRHFEISQIMLADHRGPHVGTGRYGAVVGRWCSIDKNHHVGVVDVFKQPASVILGLDDFKASAVEQQCPNLTPTAENK